MNYLCSTLLISLLTFAASNAHAGDIYRWRDASGVVHYGNVMPAQAAGAALTVIDKHGVVINQTQAALTAEQRAAQKNQQAILEQQRHNIQEQKRHDTALLNTYTSSQEIDLARADNLKQIQLMINGINAQLSPLLAKRAQMQSHADGSKTDKYRANERLITDLDNQLVIEQHNYDDTKNRFDADKARFIELTRNSQQN